MGYYVLNGGLLMFEVGDKIVYPNHGAGTIVGIEEKEVLGETKKYYIMKLPIGEMKVMIPLDNVEDIGIREIIDSERVEDVIKVLEQEKSEMSQNWNRRYRSNTEKIKTGDIFEVAEVVRNLTLRDMEKGLSTGEKKMLSNCRQILISELVLAKDESEEEVQEQLDELFADRDVEEE
ncbi:MAG: CarD family transcriptional regulator [Candidatus Frackibacter sp. T328-2]|nr:MAG: CarD family transcriptional regulator [Candidatus Frackibacter sp. T328-2]